MTDVVYKKTGKVWGHLRRIVLDPATATPRHAEVLLPFGRFVDVPWPYLKPWADGYRLTVGEGELALTTMMQHGMVFENELL
jgi:hypothetical protein